MNGRFKFVVDPTSGHVVSDKAVKTVPAVVEDLLGRKLSECEFLPLCPTGDELEALKLKVAQRVAAAKAKKEAKKKDKGEAGEVGVKRPASEEAEGEEGKAVKKQASTLPAAPKGATDKVWNSLFLDPKDKTEDKNDFMVRGGHSRGQRIGM